MPTITTTVYVPVTMRHTTYGTPTTADVDDACIVARDTAKALAGRHDVVIGHGATASVTIGAGIMPAAVNAEERARALHYAACATARHHGAADHDAGIDAPASEWSHYADAPTLRRAYMEGWYTARDNTVQP